MTKSKNMLIDILTKELGEETPLSIGKQITGKLPYGKIVCRVGGGLTLGGVGILLYSLNLEGPMENLFPAFLSTDAIWDIYKGTHHGLVFEVLDLVYNSCKTTRNLFK